MALFTSQKPWMLEAIAEYDVTMQMAHALMSVPESGSMRMSELANELSCDASNVTGVVDRLEARGFVERRLSSEDRRVKCVGLTTAGKRMRRRLEERFDDVPPAIASLSAADQRTLRELLERALGHAETQRGTKAAS